MIILNLGRSKEEIAGTLILPGKWWDYYVRGRWYAEGGYWDEASGDFKRPLTAE